MTTLTPTKATGAIAQPAEALYIDPECQISENAVAHTIDLPGVNGAFVADVISAMLAHERCGAHLYRSVASRTNNPMLERRYKELGEETEHHVEVLEQLVTSAGGNPNYVSAMARLVEGTDSKLLESTFMLNGAADIMTEELGMLDAVFLAESMDHANWHTFAALVDSLPDGEIKNACAAAVADVEDQEDEHLDWARSTKRRLVELQATSAIAAKAEMKAEEMLAAVRNWLS
ncbi:MAG TPA: DUF892 family protein [Acidimicrobiia bacterium]|jgi:rubrerythrin